MSKNDQQLKMTVGYRVRGVGHGEYVHVEWDDIYRLAIHSISWREKPPTQLRRAEAFAVAAYAENMKSSVKIIRVVKKCDP